MASKRKISIGFPRDIAELSFEQDVERAYNEREFAFAALQSKSWKQRYAALVLLNHHWQIDSEIQESACKSAFENDKHIQVRLNALTKLGKLFEHTFDENISRYLARIVLDENHPYRLRRSAYDAIEKVRTEVPVPSEFRDRDIDEIVKSIEQLKSKLDTIKNRDPDTSFDFDRGLMNELAREE